MQVVAASRTQKEGVPADRLQTAVAGLLGGAGIEIDCTDVERLVKVADEMGEQDKRVAL